MSLEQLVMKTAHSLRTNETYGRQIQDMEKFIQGVEKQTLSLEKQTELTQAKQMLEKMKQLLSEHQTSLRQNLEAHNLGSVMEVAQIMNQIIPQ